MDSLILCRVGFIAESVEIEKLAACHHSGIAAVSGEASIPDGSVECSVGESCSVRAAEDGKVAEGRVECGPGDDRSPRRTDGHGGSSSRRMHPEGMGWLCPPVPEGDRTLCSAGEGNQLSLRRDGRAAKSGDRLAPEECHRRGIMRRRGLKCLWTAGGGMPPEQNGTTQQGYDGQAGQPVRDLPDDSFLGTLHL